MARKLWPCVLFLSVLQVIRGYTLIETYQLFSILQTPGSQLHILEVSGINEGDSALLPHIPTSKCISLKDLSDLSSWPLVKAPKQEDLVVRMKTYGIKLNNTPVVLYDRLGLLFAAKAWWIFTVFGRDYVKVLNGGLPKWMREGYATQTGPRPPLLDPLTQNSLEYGYKLDPKRMWSISDLTTLSGSLASPPIQPFPIQLLDVRTKADFDVSSVKGSINMPIDIVRRADGTLRSAIELHTIFQMYFVKVINDTLTVVIGLNGVDSSMALLSLSVVGNDHSAMVDGGWLEYSQWLRNTTTGGGLALKTSGELDVNESSLSLAHLAAAAGVALSFYLSFLYCLHSAPARRRAQLQFTEKWL